MSMSSWGIVGRKENERSHWPNNHYIILWIIGMEPLPFKGKCDNPIQNPGLLPLAELTTSVLTS